VHEARADDGMPLKLRRESFQEVPALHRMDRRRGPLNGGQFVIGKAERHGASQSEGLARRPISRTAGLRERNPPAAKAFGILAKRPGRGLHSPRWRKKTRAGYENYGVFSGLALAPSPPPVPAALALLGLVSLPGAP
jgi:hypothetical protein